MTDCPCDDRTTTYTWGGTWVETRCTQCHRTTGAPLTEDDQ